MLTHLLITCTAYNHTFRAKQSQLVAVETTHPPKALPQFAGKENDVLTTLYCDKYVMYTIMINSSSYNTMSYMYILFIIGKKRTRCGECIGCTSSDCGTCKFCKDKPKFGGRGTLKQCCVKRKCTRMYLNGNFDFLSPLISLLELIFVSYRYL